MPLKSDTLNILNNFTNALAVEIAAIGDLPFRIIGSNGRLLNSTGELFIYKFELENTEDVPDDTDVEISINGKRSKAKVISSRGIEMMIALESDYGINIPKIIIEISNTNLLKSLKQLLERIKINNIQINEHIILKLFGRIEPLMNNEINIFLPPLSFELDEHQLKTIENTINSEVSFIWGPPGTGKTVVIAILTKMFIEAGYSVLVTSNTNIAVDNVFDKYIELFKTTSADLENGKIIRFGNIQIDSIKEFVQESAIIQRIAAPIYQQIKSNLNNLKPLIEKKSQLTELIKEYQKFQHLKVQFDQFLRQSSKIESELVILRKDLDNHIQILWDKNQEILDLEKKLNLSQNTNAFLRLLKRIKAPQKITEEIKQVKQTLTKLVLKSREISNSIKSKQNEIKLVKEKLLRLKDEINKLKLEVPDIENNQVANIQSEIDQVTLGITEIERQINELKNQIEDLKKNLLNEAKVIGSTLSMFHSKSNLYSRRYDVVIIDEVTMAIQPQIFFASSFSNKKVIVVGDFYQLQPIIHSSANEQVKEWLKKDIFRKNMIISRTDKRLNTLRIQRRMKAPIAEISNSTLYDGILSHQINSTELNNEPAVSFYNTSNFRPYSTIPPRGRGRINVYNAILSVKLAQKYFLLGNISSIGIITPYRSQANLISKLIRDLNLQNKVSGDVVHKFQGLEKDVVIFDITDGINTRGYRLGANLRDNEESPYLFNVAFTRAKYKLIVIGDLDYLRKNIDDLPNTVRNMLGKITLNADNNYEIVDSMEIIDDLIYQNRDDKILQNFQTNGIRHFTEESFYQDFFKEINECNDSLTIYSPFIAHYRITNNFNQNFFEDLINNRIRIKIITRPFSSHPNPDFAKNCIEKWGEIGITIETREGMHEKIAIIDDKIIYHGSLNILSQWRSQETMLKIEGKNSVSGLLSVYS